MNTNAVITEKVVTKLKYISIIKKDKKFGIKSQ